MAERPFHYQPGSVLHQAIVGAFRANGSSYSAWCRDNGITETVARQATCGQSSGERNRAMLERMIDAAGREFVRVAYEKRLLDHADLIRKGAA